MLHLLSEPDHYSQYALAFTTSHVWGRRCRTSANQLWNFCQNQLLHQSIFIYVYIDKCEFAAKRQACAYILYYSIHTIAPIISLSTNVL